MLGRSRFLVATLLDAVWLLSSLTASLGANLTVTILIARVITLLVNRLFVHLALALARSLVAVSLLRGWMQL